MRRSRCVQEAQSAYFRNTLLAFSTFNISSCGLPVHMYVLVLSDSALDAWSLVRNIYLKTRYQGRTPNACEHWFSALLGLQLQMHVV